MVMLTLLFGISFIFLVGFAMAIVAAPPMVEDRSNTTKPEDDF
jgi:hypothetical protein